MKKRGSFRKSHIETETTPFSPETHYAVIRSSICTGEKVAGFRSRSDGRFSEIMLIRSQKDLEDFKREYKVDTIKTEY